MKETNFATTCSLRQRDLQRQIVEAFENKEGEKLSMLEFKWAHRYGIHTLPRNLYELNPLNPNIFLDKGGSGNTQVFENDDKGYKPNKYIEHSSELEENLIDSELEIDSLEPETNAKLDNCEDLNSIESESKTFANHKVSNIPLEEIVIAPPPRPSLSRLRRWLPDVGDSLPKAS